MITRPHLVALSWGVVGMLFAVLALHIFFDHMAFHSLLSALQRQQQVK